MQMGEEKGSGQTKRGSCSILSRLAACVCGDPKMDSTSEKKTEVQVSGATKNAARA